MRLSGQMRLSRPSFKVGDGKANNERKDASARYAEDSTRDESYGYYDRREVTDSRRVYNDAREDEESLSDDSSDGEITFLDDDLPLEEEPASPKKKRNWSMKKKKFKGFPIIATIKKKIKRRKEKKSQRNMNHLEILPEDEAVSLDIPEPSNWEKFMNTVAFPEVQIGRLYRDFVEYVSTHEKKTDSTPVIEYGEFKKIVEERQQSEREPIVTDKQWENFMDTIAFPEKSIPALFGSPKNATTTTPTTQTAATNSSNIKTTSKEATTAKSIKPRAYDDFPDDDDSLEEEEEEEEEEPPPEPKRSVNVTMFKHTKFDSLGFRPQHLYGRTGVYITEIIEGSKSSATKLRTGMRIATINGKPCPDNVADTIALLSQLQGYVSIRAVPEAPHSVLSSGMDDVAFALKYLFTGGGVADGSTKVSSVSSVTTSYIPGDESTTGMSTYWENDDDTELQDEETVSVEKLQPQPKAKPAAKSWSEADHVELARLADQAYELMFNIKKRRGEWVGLSLMRNADWPGVYIERVDPRSKFASTQLCRGMKLLEINGTPCPEDLRQAIYMIFDTHGKLELTVEDSDGLYCHEEGSMVDTLSHDDFRENYGGFLVQNLRLDG